MNITICDKNKDLINGMINVAQKTCHVRLVDYDMLKDWVDKDLKRFEEYGITPEERAGTVIEYTNRTGKEMSYETYNTGTCVEVEYAAQRVKFVMAYRRDVSKTTGREVRFSEAAKKKILSRF